MGRVKEQWMQELEQGYSSIDATVCSECVNDTDIKEFILKTGTKDTCSYCKTESIAIDFDSFMEKFIGCIRTEYGDPNNEGMPWEGGWVHEEDVLDGYDIVNKYLETDSTELLGDVCSSIGDNQWCKVNYYGSTPHEILSSGWERFANTIKHRSRYTFYRNFDEEVEQFDPDGIPTQTFLDELSKLFNANSMYAVLRKGDIVFRVRSHRKAELFTKSSQLGTAPIVNARFSNRMSPAGIPMFYCSTDASTAIKEVYDNKTGAITIAKFELLKDLNVIDLTKAPMCPGIFSGHSRAHRQSIQFLNDFVLDFSKPVEKSFTENIEYIPTQVITEHLKFQHKIAHTIRVDGVKYFSAKENATTSIVLFVDNKQCIDESDLISEPAIVKLIESERVLTKAKITKRITP